MPARRRKVYKTKENGYICTIMERIKLTKAEKQVFRLVVNKQACPETYPKHVYTGCILSLERKGLVKGVYAEGGKAVDARLTEEGACYFSTNPSLRNPQDWKWVVGTAIAATALVVSVLALCIACTLLK